MRGVLYRRASERGQAADPGSVESGEQILKKTLAPGMFADIQRIGRGLVAALQQVLVSGSDARTGGCEHT